MKFTVVMPDGTTYTERQDIGDGDGGVLDFLAQYPKYQDILPLLQQSTPPVSYTHLDVYKRQDKEPFI